MNHPFFEASGYPWEREDAQELYNSLRSKHVDPKEIDLLYQQSGGEALPQLTPGQPPHLMWKEILENVANQLILKRLCSLLAVSFSKDTRIQDALRSVEVAVPVIDEIIFDENIIVLDRNALREKLKLLAAAGSPKKVLLVRGEPQSGKSHGRYLFDRLAAAQKSSSIYLCATLVATLSEVLIELFGALGAVEQIPPINTTPDAWYRLVCIKLMQLAEGKKKVLWIAVDDLGRSLDGASLMDPDIRAFFEQFALRMINPAFNKWFRLMLIHYPEGVPTKWHIDIWTEDRADSADVQQRDIEDVLTAWLKKRRRTVVEAEVQKQAAEIIAKADAPVPAGQNQSGRLRRIHDALVQIFATLSNTPA